MPRIELQTKIAAPVERVFDLARSIDAHVASMTESRERAIAGVISGLIGLDDQVTWRATHFRIPFTMTSRIVAMDVPIYFVDEQIRGPFGRFHHEHRFISVGEATQMIDAIEYASPFGVIGRTIDRIGLERYLTSLIRVRNQHLKTEAEKGPSVS